MQGLKDAFGYIVLALAGGAALVVLGAGRLAEAFGDHLKLPPAKRRDGEPDDQLWQLYWGPGC